MQELQQRRLVRFLVVFLALAWFGAYQSPLQAADNSRYFPEPTNRGWINCNFSGGFPGFRKS